MKKFIEALANLLKSDTPSAKRLAARLEESPEKSAELVAHHLGSSTQPIRLPTATPIAKYPISKHSEETGWLFIKEFEGTYDQALSEARKLQSLDTGFSYRIWDDRDDPEETPEEKYLELVDKVHNSTDEERADKIQTRVNRE